MVDPPTRPLYRPRVSRAAPDTVGADAVTETTKLRKLADGPGAGAHEAADDAVTTTVRASPGTASPTSRPEYSGTPSPPSPMPRVRRLPGPSETGRLPSPKPRASEGEPETVTVAATDLAVTQAPVSRPAMSSGPVLRPSTGPRPAVAAPVSSPTASPVARTPTPTRTGTADSAAALERAGLAGLHPLTRRQPLRKRGMRRMVEQVPAPYSLVGDGEDVPALLTRMYAMVVRDHWGGGDSDTTHVVQLTPWYSCDMGFELVSAGRILGHAPVHGDITPDVPVDPPEPDDPADAPVGAPTPTIFSLRHPSVDASVRSALADADRVIVVADTSRSDRRTVQDTVAALSELGVVVAGLVVFRGRIPRDPSYGR